MQGDKNIIKFEGDHNSPRPQFYFDSINIFFHNVLQPPEDEVGPTLIGTMHDYFGKVNKLSCNASGCSSWFYWKLQISYQQPFTNVNFFYFQGNLSTLHELGYFQEPSTASAGMNRTPNTLKFSFFTIHSPIDRYYFCCRTFSNQHSRCN